MGYIEGARENILSENFGGAASTTGVHAAVTDNGAQQVVVNGLIGPPFPAKITATAGGTAGDIKAITVTVAGLDPAGQSISEVLPAFTVDTPGTVTGLKVFAKVTSVTIPAHDGTGATTAIGHTGSPAVATTGWVKAAVTDNGAPQVFTGTALINPDVPRCITATAGGTGADIKAIQVVVEGTDAAGNPITESLPAFTVDTPGTVTGTKAFKTVTKVTIPAHDGTGATTAIGTSEKIGLKEARKRKTVLASYLNGVLEGTAATETFDATDVSKNTVDLNSALNSTPVAVEYVTAHN